MVSVIVPVYNAQAYLQECVISVLMQTYCCLELILIDDGSSDESGKMCDHFYEMDGRVKVIHQPNRGLAAARNVGLDVCVGDYVMFVDADDVLHENCIKRMLEVIEREKCDVVCCRQCEGETPHWKCNGNASVEMFSAHDAIEDILYQRKLNCSLCGKLYDVRLFDNKRLVENMWYEDLEFVPRLLKDANAVACLPQDMYFYRQWGGSFMHTFSAKRLDALKAVDMIENMCRDMHDDDMLKAALDRKFAANFNMLVLLSQQGKKYADIADECWLVIKKYRSFVLSNGKSRLKNKIGAWVSMLGKRATIALSKVVCK